MPILAEKTSRAGEMFPHFASICVIIRHLLVFDKDNLLGIFTERDYLKKVFLEQDDSDAVITKYLTTPPITLSINHTVSQILEPMYNGHFRHLPIYTSKNNFH